MSKLEIEKPEIRRAEAENSISEEGGMKKPEVLNVETEKTGSKKPEVQSVEADRAGSGNSTVHNTETEKSRIGKRTAKRLKIGKNGRLMLQKAGTVKNKAGKAAAPKAEKSAAPKAENRNLNAIQADAISPEMVEIEKIETEVADKKSQNLMNLIRRVHGLVENPDIGKHRQSQDHIGAILSNTKTLSYREVDVDGMYGEWVSVNRAHMKKYIILHCHGGGYSTGSSLYARTLTSKLAESTSMDVFCFDYRLAPEHPYPAAAQDAMKAWNYLMLLGYGARDVVLTGDSAGGNLALALVLKLKEEKRLLPRGLVLMSPWTDLTSSGKSFETKAELDPVLNRPYIDRMVKAYAEGQNLEDAFISPLFGNFEGFPPAYIQVGENEILLSDSLRLHQAFIDANVSVKLDVWPGMWHVFQMSPMKTAWNAMDKNAEFIYDICR